MPQTVTSIGSLCTGYGGLDEGVKAAVGGQLSWYAEIDPAANLILEDTYPGVPNLGDLRQLPWSELPAVDVVVAGPPCQPVSEAGKQTGRFDGRWLFDAILDGIAQMNPRPALVVMENVYGLALIHQGYELYYVRQRLENLGYDVSSKVTWASDIGAPHARKRVFIVGTKTPIALAAPAPRDTLPTCNPFELLPTPRSRDHRGNGARPYEAGRPLNETIIKLYELDLLNRYDLALEHWAQILGRLAPPMLEPGRRDNLRLSAGFSEWMMGLPQGLVTYQERLTHRDQIRIIGNGVVPLQAEHAMRNLLWTLP